MLSLNCDKDAQDGGKTSNDMIKGVNSGPHLLVKMKFKANVLQIAIDITILPTATTFCCPLSKIFSDNLSRCDPGLTIHFT